MRDNLIDKWQKRVKFPIKKTAAIFGIVASALFPAYCYFTAEYIHFAAKDRFLHFMDTRVGSVFFGLIALYIVFAVVLLLCKRAWIPALIMSLITFSTAVSDYFKFMLRGEHFYPWDITEAPNLGSLISYLKNPLPLLYILFAVGAILVIALLIITKTGLPFRAYIRLPAAVLVIVIIWFSLSSSAKRFTMFRGFGMRVESLANAENNFIESGFVGATIMNLLSSSVEKPANYSKQEIDALLAPYDNIPASEDFLYPDIILILSESFYDIRRLPGTTFSFDPMSHFDEISARDTAYSGKFLSPTFGGGTVRPEFEVLTGLVTAGLPAGSVPYQFVKTPLESYVTPYKELGYKSIALHTNNSNFYNRKSRLPLLGFDELYFTDDLAKIAGVERIYRGGQISDESFVKYLMRLTDASDSPAFVFGISMENHQPYTNKYAPENLVIEVANPQMDADTLAAVTHYSQGLADADAALGLLADYIEARERPTVLVFYGDHAPYLGADYAAFRQSGFITGEVQLGSEMLSTPFLVYANFEFKEENTGSFISPYNLMNTAAKMIGAPRTPLMQYLDSEADLDHLLLLTYDRIAGKKYSER